MSYAAYATHLATKATAKEAAKVYRRERVAEIRAITAEARAVGFTVPGFMYFGKDSDNSFTIHAPDGTRLSTGWFGDREDAVPEWCIFANQSGVPELTEEQLRFLTWSADWQVLIWPYWRGKTEHADIHALIAHMKARDMPTIAAPRAMPTGLVCHICWDQE